MKTDSQKIKYHKQNIKSQIMKKLATIIGLLSLMLVVTSFTTPNNIGGRSQEPTLSIGGRSQEPTLAIGGRSQEPTLSIGGRSQEPTLSIGGRSQEPI